MNLPEPARHQSVLQLQALAWTRSVSLAKPMAAPTRCDENGDIGCNHHHPLSYGYWLRQGPTYKQRGRNGTRGKEHAVSVRDFHSYAEAGRTESIAVSERGRKDAGRRDCQAGHY